jgi:hypothetical protein
MSDQHPDETMIPKARLDEVLAKLAAAEKAKATAEKKAETWQAKYEAAAADVIAAREEGEAKLAELQDKYETDKVFGAAGIDDPDVIDLVRTKYAKAEAPTNEDGTPGTKPALADWYKEYAATKPAILRPFLKDATEPAKAAPAKANTPAKSVAAPPPQAPAAKREQPPSATPPADFDPDSWGKMDTTSRRAVLAEMGLYAPKGAQ